MIEAVISLRRPVYEGLQHWLLDYDRSQMDQLFTEK
ncbi:DUF3885 domain-containing protein [Bacillus pumilus]|nr:DUF3885 domain-containing protein [Bacillus pumilus]MCY7433857.1 DUF3885 domain-containing protein [Bacillus pumilus]